MNGNVEPRSIRGIDRCDRHGFDPRRERHQKRMYRGKEIGEAIAGQLAAPGRASLGESERVDEDFSGTGLP